MDAQPEEHVSEPTLNYDDDTTPENYTCRDCGAVGVRLFREYQTFIISLLCRACAKIEQGADDVWERETLEMVGRPPVFEVKWRVAAVPDEEGIGYWGYTSIPQRGIDWWLRLPVEVGATP